MDHCQGIAYRLDAAVYDEVIDALDHREKNGYERCAINIHLLSGDHFATSSRLGTTEGATTQATTYIAPPGNFAWLGDAPLSDLVALIASSAGPSGRNHDYLRELAHALTELGVDDPHVQQLWEHVRVHLARMRPME